MAQLLLGYCSFAHANARRMPSSRRLLCLRGGLENSQFVIGNYTVTATVSDHSNHELTLQSAFSLSREGYATDTVLFKTTVYTLVLSFSEGGSSLEAGSESWLAELEGTACLVGAIL